MRTRSKTKTNKIIEANEHRDTMESIRMNETNQWVMIASESAVGDHSSGSGAVVVKLNHPKTDAEAQFLFSEDDKEVHEVMSFEDGRRSWFIDNSVQKDGRLLMVTMVDPLFVILPYLMRKDISTKFMQLDQILTDEKYPHCSRLLNTTGAKDICYICDKKGDEDFQVYRYNEEKTLDWLKRKVEQTSRYLSTSGIQVTAGSQSSLYVRNSEKTEAPKEDCMRYAAGIISDYLHPQLSKKMFEHLGIKEMGEKKPKEVRTEDGSTEPPKKKMKTSNGEPTEDYSKAFIGSSNDPVKTTKLTAAQKKLSKVDKTGMKSISSFFKKTPATAK